MNQIKSVLERWREWNDNKGPANTQGEKIKWGGLCFIQSVILVFMVYTGAVADVLSPVEGAVMMGAGICLLPFYLYWLVTIDKQADKWERKRLDRIAKRKEQRQ